MGNSLVWQSASGSSLMGLRRQSYQRAASRVRKGFRHFPDLLRKESVEADEPAASPGTARAVRRGQADPPHLGRLADVLNPADEGHRSRVTPENGVTRPRRQNRAESVRTTPHAGT